MLYDALLFAKLPATPGRVLPAEPLQRLERLLFTGTPTAREMTCALSAGGVLAGCYAGLRAIGARTIRVHSDADEVLDIQLEVGPGDGTGATALPTRWTRDICTFALHAVLPEPGGHKDLSAAVQLRFTPSHPEDGHALCGALRLGWKPLHQEEEPLDHTRVHAALLQRTAMRVLRTTLQQHGDLFAGALCARLEDALSAKGSFHGTTRILHGIATDRRCFTDRTRGLPSPTLEALAAIDTLMPKVVGRWPAVDRRGVDGWVRRGRFVSSAGEVVDAA